MPTVNCKKCRKPFIVKPNRLNRGWGKFCSRACQFEGMRNGTVVSCATCGKPVYRTPGDQQKTRSGRFYCSKSCFAKWKNKLWAFGEEHFNWKHGGGAYRNTMLRSNKTPICLNCKLKDIRVLIVHHIDEDRKNNRLDNLMWLCRNCHYLIHEYKVAK